MRQLAVALALAVGASPAGAETFPLPTAPSPESVGLSSAQLKRLEAVTRQHVDDGLVPGAVMLVARRGQIAWQATIGRRDPATDDAMAPDAIFRIYSMTKPIVSVAVLQMVEEGRLQIGDPAAKFLPEIGRMQVGRETVAADGKKALELMPPDRAMTVQDLLRHTSGLIYGTRGDSLVNQAYIEARIGNRSLSNAQMVAKLGALPLRFSPGARWEYGVSTDVLGRLVEVVDGKPLGEALAARVLRPLGMTDTGFQVPADKLSRVAQPGPRPNGLPMTPRFRVDDGAAYESGGGGLTSTAADYLRFCAALLAGGRLGEARLLGRQTVAFMTADHVGRRPGRPPGLGFGLGFEVRTEVGEAGLPGSLGEHGWAGNAGTLFWIDPREQLIALYMVQVSDPDRVALRNQFRTMVQAAIID